MNANQRNYSDEELEELEERLLEEEEERRKEEMLVNGRSVFEIDRLRHRREINDKTNV